MDEALKTIIAVCEHAQATGGIRTLKDAEIVFQAIKTLAAGINDIKAMRERIAKMEVEKTKSELHS